jgi:Spy/CpxP family protein refolding chaperone
MKKILMGALSLLLITAAAQAQDTTQKGQHRKQQIETLNLTTDQKARLKTLREAQQKEWTALKKDKAALTEADKKQRREMQQKYQAQMKAILTPEQQAQLAQNRAQHQKSARAKGQHKGMKEVLNLTEVQQTKMKALNSDFKTKRETLRKDTSLTEAQKKEGLKAIAQQHRSEVKSMLTAEQQQKLETMRKEHRKGAGK